MSYYILIPIKGDDVAIDTYKVLTIKEKEQAFKIWQDTVGSTVVRDVEFKIMEVK